MLLTLLGIALILLIVWLFLRSRGKAQTKLETAAPEDAGSSAYHAVSIKYDIQACEAAQAMGGRRFLSTAAPRLPLPECDLPECRCRFTHHKDRRSGGERRSPFGSAGLGGGTGFFESERRERIDRRKKTDSDR